MNQSVVFLLSLTCELFLGFHHISHSPSCSEHQWFLSFQATDAIMSVFVKWQWRPPKNSPYCSFCWLPFHCILYSCMLTTSEFSEECSMGALLPPGSTDTEKKTLAPCLSTQPQLKPQLLFSLKATCYLRCQPCLFVRIPAMYGPPCSESLCPLQIIG